MNQSGASYADARLKLIAGDVQRVQPPPAYAAAAAQELRMREAPAAGFAEKAFFEYHLYTLGRTTSLADNSTKQIELFPAARGLPSGEYAVQCAQRVPAVGTPRNAFGRVVFAAAPPVRWERMQGQVRVTSKAVDSEAITEEWVKTDDLRVEVGSVAFAEPGFGERLEQLGHEYGADDFDELLQLATAGLIERPVCTRYWPVR